MRRKSEAHAERSRTGTLQSGSPGGTGPLREAMDAYMTALSLFGPDSAEALAARHFLSEISRRHRTDSEQHAP